MHLNWIKCKGGDWCVLTTVDLSHDHFDNLEGVYIIWNSAQCVRIGQGNIRDRLQEHKTDNEILSYADPTLFATWARVDSQNRDGVEAFLASHYKPAVGKLFPNVSPIQVNLPE